MVFAQISAKLNNKSGASLLMALLFIMICIMVGAVVLAAAGISTERVDAGRDEEQIYVSLRSAAELFDNGIENYQYKITTVVKTYTCPEPTVNHPEASPPQETAEDVTYDNVAAQALGNFLSSLVQEIRAGGSNIGTVTKVFTIAAADNTNAVKTDDLIVDVAVTIKMDKYFDFSVTIKPVARNFAPFILYYDRSTISHEVTHDHTDTDYHIVQEFDTSQGIYVSVNKNFPIDKEITTETYAWELSGVTKGVISNES